MILFKTIALSLSGTAGILGFTSPLMHIGATKHDWKNKWYPKTNELLEPILKNCKVSEGETRYTVFMELAGGASGPEISFRVEKTVGLWEKSNNREVVWRGGKKVGVGGLEKWQFGWRSSKEVDFMFPTQVWGSERNATTQCLERRIQPSSGGGFGSGIPLSVEEVNLSTEECQQSFSNVVCRITINASDKLKWVSGKEPKITYTAFK